MAQSIMRAPRGQPRKTMLRGLVRVGAQFHCRWPPTTSPACPDCWPPGEVSAAHRAGNDHRAEDMVCPHRLFGDLLVMHVCVCT
jgi:hypothetical protein